jgi:ribosomal protein L37AE/L43A
MSYVRLTKQELAELLREAKQLHSDYEQALASQNDENWAEWYAEFILGRLQPQNILESVRGESGGQYNAKEAPKKITKPISGSDIMGSPDNLSDQSQTEKSTAQNGGYVCPTCGHRNRPGILLCENCGTMLTTGVQPVGTRDLRDEEAVQQAEPETTDNPRKATAKLPDINDTSSALPAEEMQAVSSAGTSVFESNMVLRIEIEGGTTPILLHPKQQRDMILGRRDPTTGAMPDVDLTPYAGYRMGVSRRHSAMRLQDKQLDVWDLGSSNGTFLNGTRLNPHRPYRVKDGDEVRLGQMVLRVYFQADISR